MSNSVPFYAEHENTIRIAGRTLPDKAGKCAFHYLQKGKVPIEFLCVGGNANQQATKAMSIFCYMVRNAPEFANRNIQIAFQPLMYRMNMKDRISGIEIPKTVTVWRTLTVEAVSNEK